MMILYNIYIFKCIINKIFDLNDVHSIIFPISLVSGACLREGRLKDLTSPSSCINTYDCLIPMLYFVYIMHYLYIKYIYIQYTYYRYIYILFLYFFKVPINLTVIFLLMHNYFLVNITEVLF